MSSTEIIEDAFRPEAFEQSFTQTVGEFDGPSKNGMSNSTKIVLGLIALGLFLMTISSLTQYLEDKGYLNRKESEGNSNSGH